jgi:RNA polymerase sigma-B factor
MRESRHRPSDATVVGPPERSTQALFRRLRRTGDPRAREAIVRRFLPLARKLARRYYGGGEPLEDLVQVANLGLVKAVSRFDEDRRTSFSSYAVPTITGELKRYFRDNAWSLHVPRGLRERGLAVNRAIREATERQGRAPTTGEIAERLELEESEVLEAQVAYSAFSAGSLDEPASQDEDGSPQVRLDTLGAPDGDLARADDRMTVASEVRELTGDERRVLHMRFVEDRTQSDIAARVGVSQMQVSRILRRTLDRLRQNIEQPPRRRAARRLPAAEGGVRQSR